MANLRSFLLLVGALLPTISAAPKPASRSMARSDNVLEDASSTESHLRWVSDLHARNTGKRDTTAGIEKTYEISGWKAYAGEFDDATIAGIKASPEVAYVEADVLVPAPKLLNEQKTAPLDTLEKRHLLAQPDAEWGLVAISHRSTSSSSDYVFDSVAGQGMYAYVVDDSIRTTHMEFENRATFGFNAISNNNTPSGDHGSFTAGIIGGIYAGVAKNVRFIFQESTSSLYTITLILRDSTNVVTFPKGRNIHQSSSMTTSLSQSSAFPLTAIQTNQKPQINLISVKVFDERGASPDSVILSGYTWAVNDILSKNRTNKAVINLSLGSGNTGIEQAWVDAITAAYNQNILTTVSAGNDAAHVSQHSPANVLLAVTVAASNKSFTIADFSNYGPGVDFFAPGVGILAAASDSDVSGLYADGTSASAPFVAGVAMYLQSIWGLESSDYLVAALKGWGAARMVGKLKNSPNLFVNNGNGVD
ncbi:subtilisin-like protein [Periconia macrospinosa]|uniref:Subtilisin-like protein n=1 Tax=Periconia macrospinosa TaxID=97972 RepID=A0A2V1D5Z0_9PLEO|nr:subtilisin-like protein [Periconia macrospinosa]